MAPRGGTNTDINQLSFAKLRAQNGIAVDGHVILGYAAMGDGLLKGWVVRTRML